MGGGIVGLAVARALTRRRPRLAVTVVEKETDVGTHQTGHNSGVLHSGLYYRPGSLKARLCVTGRRQMLAFCTEHGIDVRICGKVVVAGRADQLAVLDELQRRGRANGLEGLRRLDPAGLTAVEPHAVGLGALHVPEAGVVDFRAVARALAADLQVAGGEVRTGAAVTALRPLPSGVAVDTTAGSVTARILVNCAGLHADRVAALAGVDPPIRIVPFRGEYYRLDPAADHLVRALVYPVPDPRFPFLGVHFTRRIDGTVEVGPNAVLALGREHYRGTRPQVGDVVDVLTYPGFWRVAARYWRTGAAELWRSAFRRTYAAAARSLIPDVQAADLHRAGAGVRAQAVSPDGDLVDDFSIVETPSMIHVLNAPSPAATASLAIGDHVAALVERHLD